MDASLVKLVENDRTDTGERRIADQHPGEHTLGYHLELRVLAYGGIEASS